MNTKTSATLATVSTILGYANTAFDVAAPFAGVAEFEPLVNMATQLLQKIIAAAQAKAPTLDAEIAAADAAAKAAEIAAGLK